MMRLVRNILVYVLSFLLIMPPQWALAADPISVDPTAPSANQANVTAAANGTPVVNIVKPNAAGVSHNKFSNFNVTSRGVILNNATSRATSKLGGLIEANSNLSGTAASLILNEVTGSSRSALNGPTEIGGRAADYILANPNGITCNGCGFINTPRATLTTGTPTYTGNALTGLSVERGDVVIEGLGLDASSATKFDIVTRSASINAQINANDLGIHTGRQDFDYATRSGMAKSDDGSAKPQFSIDSTALGGMYAGRITLVGTEAGVGVRLAGDMAASSSGIVLTADGKLELKSDLSAQTDIQLSSASSDITVEQAAYVQGDLSVTASSGTVQIANGGNLTAGSDVSVKAGVLNNSGTLSGGGATALSVATDFENSGTVSGQTGMTVNAGGAVTTTSGSTISSATNASVSAGGAVANVGSIETVGTLTVSGASLDNAGTLVTSDDLNATASSGALSNSGTLSGGGSTVLSASTDFENSGIVGGQTGMTVSAGGAVTTVSGSTISSAASATVNAGGVLINGGDIQVAQDLSVSGVAATNTGALVAGKALDVAATAGTVSNSGMLSGGTTVTVDAADDIGHSGSIVSQSGVVVRAGDLVTTLAGSEIDSGANVGVTAGTAFNHSGAIDAVQNITAKGATVAISATGKMAAGGALGVTATTGDAVNYGILSGGTAQFNAATNVSNMGTVTSQNGTSVVAGGTVSNQAGSVISSDTNTSVSAGSAVTNFGGINAAGVLTVSGTALDNTGGLASGGNLVASATGQSISNSGMMSSGGNANLSAVTDVYNTGALSSQGDTDISSSGTVRSATGSSIKSENALNINAQGNVTQNGTLGSGSDMTVRSGATVANQGNMVAGRDLTVSAGTGLSNTGILYAGRNLAASNSANTLTNTGTMASEGSLAASSSKITNSGTVSGGTTADVAASANLINSGTIASQTGTTVSAGGSITVNGGASVKSGAVTQIVSQSTLSNSGELSAVTDLVVRATAITNPGTLASGRNLLAKATTGNIANAGTMSGGASATLNAAVDVSNTNKIGAQANTIVTAGNTISNAAGGSITSAGIATLSAATLANAGDVYGAGDVFINVPTITNSSTIAAGGSLDFDTTTLSNNAGVLYAQNDMTVGGYGGAVRATLFDNASGTVETATGSININAGAIQNRKSAFNYSSSLKWHKYFTQTGSDGCTNNINGGRCIWTYTLNSPLGTYSYSYSHRALLMGKYYEAALTEDSPSSLMSAGNGITINADTFSNTASTVNAGGNINISAGIMNNEAVELYSRLDIYYPASEGRYIPRAQKAIGSYNSVIQAGGNLTITSSGGVRNGTEQVYSPPAAGSYSASIPTLPTPQVTSGLIDTTQYVDMIPGQGALFVRVDAAATLTVDAEASDTPSVLDALSTTPVDVLPPAMTSPVVTPKVTKIKYVYETRAPFIDVGKYFGSDYFLNLLGGYDPEEIPTRLGDAYFETQLVRQAIVRETGKRWLDDTVTSDIQQMKNLLDNGVSVGRDLNLSFGVALSREQIAALTSDIIWYEEQSFEGRTVLVPKVYLASATRATLSNKGAILAGDNVTINADTIDNDHGAITASNDVTLTAEGDLKSTSADITAGGDVALTSTGGDVAVGVQVDQSRVGGSTFAVMHRKSSVTAGGDLTVTANDNVSIKGTDVKVGGDASLIGNGDVTIGSAEGRQKTSALFSRSTATKNVGSTVQVGGKLDITAGGNAQVKGTAISAGDDITLAAVGNVTIESAANSVNINGNKGDVYARTDNTAAGLTSGGGDVSVTSGGTLNVRGSTLSASNDLEVQATGDVTVDSSQDTFDSETRNYTTKTITQKRSVLEAGGDVTVGTLVGNLSLISSELQSGGDIALNTPNGTLYLGARKDYVEKRENQVEYGGLTMTVINRGTIDETVVPTLMTAAGNIAIVTGDGTIVDYRDTGSLTDSIDQLSQSPGLAWMKDVQARSDVQWNAIEEIHQSWDYRTQGISPTGAALISLAVSAAVGPAGFMDGGVGANLLGSEITNALGVEAVVGNAIANAGFSNLVSQALTAIVGNGGDIGAALQQLGSMDSVKALATSMVTAGLMEGLDLSTSLGTPTNELNQMTDGARQMAEFADKLKVGIAQSVVSSTVDSISNGTPFTENLKNSLVSAAVTIIGAEAANQIGAAAQSGDINKATQLVAHAALGCAMGQASAGDCASGAGGAVVGELTAWGYESMTGDELRADLDAIRSSEDLSPAQKNFLVHSKVATWKTRGVNMSQLSSALAAGLADGDANVAAMTGSNAAENNAFWVPVLLVVAAYTTYSGDGNPLDGLAAIGEGEDPLSKAIESGTTAAVEFSAAHYPEETMATLSVIEAIGDGVDATVTYFDDATGNYVSAQWNSLDPELRSQIKGSGKIASIFVPGGAVVKLTRLKSTPDIDVAKAQDIINDVDISGTVSSTQVAGVGSAKGLDDLISVGTRRSAEDVNSGFPEGYAPPYTPGTQVTEFVSDGSQTFVRVVSGDAPAGQWVMRQADIEGLTPEQIADKFALPQIPTGITSITPPSGTRIRTGKVNENFGRSGGGTQFQLLDIVDSGWANVTPIE